MTYRAPPTPTLQRAHETEELIARKATDVARWASFDNLATQWDERAAKAAEWIPDDVSVLDVGCGAMALGDLLKPGCRYVPADVVERRPGALVADLNRREFPPGTYDWISFLGVLEYVHDVGWTLAQAAAAAPNLLATYCTHTAVDVAVRRGMGWVNDFTRDEFEAVLAGAGWQVDRAAELKRGATNTQIMYTCRRRIEGRGALPRP